LFAAANAEIRWRGYRRQTRWRSETQIAADQSAQRLVLGQDVALDSVCAGGLAEKHLATDKVLGDPVTADGILPTLLGAQRAGGAARCAPGHVDGRGGIGRHLQTLELVGQYRRVGGEVLCFPVPGDLTCAELLGSDLTVVGFVADRGTENAARAAEFVPRGVHCAAHHKRAVVRRP
jgi:hypothetical protein